MASFDRPPRCADLEAEADAIGPIVDEPDEDRARSPGRRSGPGRRGRSRVHRSGAAVASTPRRRGRTPRPRAGRRRSSHAAGRVASTVRARSAGSRGSGSMASAADRRAPGSPPKLSPIASSVAVDRALERDRPVGQRRRSPRPKLMLNGSLLKNAASASTTVERSRSLRKVVVPAMPHVRRHVVQDVAGAARLLALDPHVEEQVAVRPRQDHRALGRQLADRPEVRVVGQLVDHRVPRVQLRGVVAELGRVAEEHRPDDPVGQRLPELVRRERGVDGRRGARPRGPRAPRPSRRGRPPALEHHVGRVLDRALSRPSSSAGRLRISGTFDRGLGTDGPQRAEPDAEVRGHAPGRPGGRRGRAGPVPPKNSPLMGDGEEGPAGHLELVRGAGRREDAEVDLGGALGRARCAADDRDLVDDDSLPRRSGPEAVRAAANATIRTGIVTHAHSRRSSRRRTR